MVKKEKILIAAAFAVTLLSGFLHYIHANAVLGFSITAAALAMVAMSIPQPFEHSTHAD